MFKFLLFVIHSCFLMSISHADEAKLKAFADSVLTKIAQDKAILAAVQSQNSTELTLDKIKELDGVWTKTAGYDDFMKKLMQNDCAKALNSAAKSNKAIVEAFAMDKLGANVCMIDKTSDYWQGDEAKFEKSFAAGKGSIFIDKVKFDESTQSYTVQISVPVMNAGKAIGAITFGLNVDEVK